MAGMAEFENLIKSMGVEDEGMVTQAQQIWEMLDDMAATSPERYKAFMAKQMEEKKKLDEDTKPPTPVFAIRALLLGRGGYVWLSFCSSSKVSVPKSDSAPIPVVTCKGVERNIKDIGMATVYDVVFNPSIIERAEANSAFKDLLVELALQSVEDKETLALDRAVKKHKQPLSYVADVPEPNPQAQVTADPMELLTKLKSGQFEGDSSLGTEVPNVELPFGPSQAPKKNLIQEVVTPLLEPEHTVSIEERHLKVTVVLPDVKGVSDIDLDVTPSVLELTVEGRFHLCLTLPKQVDVDSAKAKFKKKKTPSKNYLVLTLEINDS